MNALINMVKDSSRVRIPLTPEGLIRAVGQRCEMTVKFEDSTKIARHAGLSACFISVPTFFIGGAFVAVAAALAVAAGVFAVYEKRSYKPLDEVLKTRFSPENKKELGLKLENTTNEYPWRTVDQVEEDLERRPVLAHTLAAEVSSYLKARLRAVDVRHNCQLPQHNS